jgi:hypothetical protein
LLNPRIADAPAWLTGGTVGPEGSILTLILWALLTLAFLALYKPQPDVPAITGTAGDGSALVGSPNL